MRTKIAILILAMGATLSAGTPAFARNECAGDNEQNCEYCSYDNNSDASPGASCGASGNGSYQWQGCGLYIGNKVFPPYGHCVQGGSTPTGGGPMGRKCAFNSTTDVTREAGWQLGAVNAGPLATGEDGTLVCSVHVNNDVHNGPAAATASASATGDTVVLAPQPISYPATAADEVSLCTEWRGANGTLYWVGGNTATGDLGHWDESESASCGVALSFEPNDPECSIWKAIDNRLGTDIAEIWQDCEPYDPII
jgi:hypothetical protein